METETNDYPDNGTLDDLSRTCIGDEKGFRGRLAGLERGQDDSGKNGIHATYNLVPDDQPFPKKKLFFFDITDSSADEVKDITVAELAKGHALAYPDADAAEVFLGGKEAIVAVFREG
ncbi:MAG TPA: hypothetical protein VFZ22_24120 [Pyrinomonadaceae bacterium]|nr:hypothetical protein [Pyrinomonadaceae bacterium]